MNLPVDHAQFLPGADARNGGMTASCASAVGRIPCLGARLPH
ncbi:MAG: hypothetical protein R3E42_11735 [Burkholderiaceae bacterium]